MAAKHTTDRHKDAPFFSLLLHIFSE